VSRRLVLLHGFTGSPDSWAEVLARLDPGDAIAPALLGHDGTPGDRAVRTFDDEVDRLAGLIEERWPEARESEARGSEARGPAGAHLVGYSMGGRVALGLLVRHPRLFSGATLIGASPGLCDPAERHARARRDEEWATLLESDGLDPFVAAWEALPLFATQDRASAAALDAQRRIRLAHDPRGLARSLRVTGLSSMPDYRPALPGVDLPVRVAAGADDEKFRALGQELVALLPRAELLIIEHAGHNVVLERPQEVARLLRQR
jgi:2-succinyl-6-hydroxy-2,4-cyclohexadiene-1-carboxylate synthase